MGKYRLLTVLDWSGGSRRVALDRTLFYPRDAARQDVMRHVADAISCSSPRSRATVAVGSTPPTTAALKTARAILKITSSGSAEAVAERRSTRPLHDRGASSVKRTAWRKTLPRRLQAVRCKCRQGGPIYSGNSG